MPEMVVAKTFRIGIPFAGNKSLRCIVRNVPEWEGYMDIYSKVVFTIIAGALSILPIWLRQVRKMFW
jgi:hypothetical protein